MMTERDMDVRSQGFRQLRMDQSIWQNNPTTFSPLFLTDRDGGRDENVEISDDNISRRALAPVVELTGANALRLIKPNRCDNHGGSSSRAFSTKT
jgi:hypothetical protein